MLFFNFDCLILIRNLRSLPEVSQNVPVLSCTQKKNGRKTHQNGTSSCRSYKMAPKFARKTLFHPAYKNKGERVKGNFAEHFIENCVSYHVFKLHITTLLDFSIHSIYKASNRWTLVCLSVVHGHDFATITCNNNLDFTNSRNHRCAICIYFCDL